MTLQSGRTKSKPAEATVLSDREQRVARCAATGLKNKEIADTLLISETTVRNYLNRIFRKTGTKDRLELAFWMISQDQARVS
jgi:DNA-binding NarL/FixJ family response regulator